MPDIDLLNRTSVGRLEAIYWQEDPRTGERLYGLSPRDFDRVMAGYACPRCLEMFNTYLPKCPMCDLQRDVQVDVQNAPQHWVDHLEDSKRESGGKPVDIDDFLREVAADKDVEQIKLG